MNFLFIHQNFPGQYVHVARHLHGTGHTVKFITQRRDREIEGLETLEYVPLPIGSGVQPHLYDLETNTLNGLAVARLCQGCRGIAGRCTARVEFRSLPAPRPGAKAGG